MTLDVCLEVVILSELFTTNLTREPVLCLVRSVQDLVYSELVFPPEAFPTGRAIEWVDSGVLDHVLLQVRQSEERSLTELTVMIARFSLLHAHINNS